MYRGISHSMAHVNIIYRTMEIEYQIINKVKEVNMKAIFAVINSTWAVVKIRPAQVVHITAKIAFIFTSLSAVQIYDFHIFTIVYSSLHGLIWNQNYYQLPVGLLAHLVEHCTGITEVMGSNPVQAWIFFRLYFHYCSTSVHYCVDRFHIHVFNRSSDILLSYIHSRLKWKKLAFLRKKLHVSSE